MFFKKHFHAGKQDGSKLLTFYTSFCVSHIAKYRFISRTSNSVEGKAEENKLHSKPDNVKFRYVVQILSDKFTRVG